MLFGIEITKTMMVLGGAVLYSFIVFQILVGKRKIHFKGSLHMKVHRSSAWLMLAFATFHALAGLALLGFIWF